MNNYSFWEENCGIKKLMNNPCWPLRFLWWNGLMKRRTNGWMNEWMHACMHALHDQQKRQTELPTDWVKNPKKGGAQKKVERVIPSKRGILIERKQLSLSLSLFMVKKSWRELCRVLLPPVKLCGWISCKVEKKERDSSCTDKSVRVLRSIIIINYFVGVVVAW